MRFTKLILSVALILFFKIAEGQLSGVFSVPGTYTSIGDAITDLNTQGINGPVTINISAGYTETSPVGGYALTATGSGTNTITFQKNGAGANPLITAYTGGVGTPSSAVQDGIWRLVGSDLVTIDGIDLSDPNTTNPATMEYGYGLFKASTTNGCQNNTIKNCVIRLNRINNAFGNVPSSEGSRGINMVNALPATATLNVVPTSSAGANSNNKFYSNTIQNCNIGIAMIGSATNTDQNNDVGGPSVLTGNTIIDYGGSSASTNAASGIKTTNQFSLNISFNLINSNTGAGVNHKGVLRGVHTGSANSASYTISNNTITVKSDAISQDVIAIDIESGSSPTNTVSVVNNLITNCNQTNVTAMTGSFYGINATGNSFSFIDVSNNTFLNNSSNTFSGAFKNINLTATSYGGTKITGNIINGVYFTHLSTQLSFSAIYLTNSSTSGNFNVDNNSIQGINYSGMQPLSAGNIIQVSCSSMGTVSISNNTFNNIKVSSAGSYYLIYNTGAPNCLAVNNNSITGSFMKTAPGGTVAAFFSSGMNSGVTLRVNNNSFKNIFISGSTTFHGIYQKSNLIAPTCFISNNTISDLQGGTGTIYGIYLTNSNNSSVVSNNIVSDIKSNSSIHGLSIGTANPNPGCSIYTNTVNSLSSSSSVVIGISTIYGSFINLYRNKIYDLSNTSTASTASVIGISCSPASSASNNFYIYNNLVGDLRAPATSNPNGVIGLSLPATVANTSSVNIYCNTIVLNAASTATTFGTAGIFHQSNATASSNKLTLNNNIIINNSVPNGSGISAAIKRGGVTLSNFASTSNNNLLYAGTPGPSNLIYYDGTNAYQTLSSYTSAVTPRDGNSVTENTSFLTTVGSSTAFLHVNNFNPTLAESRATYSGTLDIDYDGDTRQGYFGYTGTGTAPDVGADEFEPNFTACTNVIPGVITPTLITKCFGQPVSFTPAGTTMGAGITYQWKVSTTSGGPYANVTGGTGSNSMAYSPGAVGPGTLYYILVTTCTVSGIRDSTNEVQLTVNPLPSVSISGTNTICNGDTILLTGSGAPNCIWDTGLLTNTITVIPSTNTVYTLTGIDANGCVNSAVHSVTVNPVPLVLIWPGPAVCIGSVGTLTATGALTYTWNTGSNAAIFTDNPTTTTAYTVTGTNAFGCTSAASTSIIINPQPTLNIVSTASVLCIGQSATLSASGASTYYWNPGGTASSIVVTPTTTTTYTIIGDDWYCKDTVTFTQNVSACTGIDVASTSSATKVFIYPNPSSGAVTVKAKEDLQIQVYNVIGELILSTELKTETMELDLSHHANGIYFVRIGSVTKKIIKE